MSTISGSDNSSRQDEVTRRNREEAQRSESEMVKKHQKEIRRLTEAHYQEMERVKQAQAQQLRELQKNSGETISARDMKHSRDVENLRSMHRKQLSDLANNAQREIEMAREANRRELEGMRSRNEEKISDITLDHKLTMEKKDKDFTDSLQNIRESQKNSINDYREKMNKKHQKELEIVADQREQEVRELGGQYNSYRKNAESRIKDQELRHFQERQRAGDALVDSVRRERQNQAANEKILRDGFRAGIDDMKSKYEQAMEDERNARIRTESQTKSDVFGRVNDQMNTLERKNADLKAANTREELTRKRETDLQMKNLRDAYQANVADWQRQRDEALQVGNERRAKDLKELHSVKDQEIVDLNRRYLQKSEDQEVRHRMDFDNLENDFAARHEQAQNIADVRIQNIRSESDLEKARLAELHNNSRQVMRRGFEEEKREIVNQQSVDKNQALERMKAQMRKQEVQHQDKLARVTQKYEKELASLRDELTRVRRESDENARRVVSEMERQRQVELDAQQLQAQEKVRKVQEQHADEIKVVNKRHQERLEQVLTAAKKNK